MNRGRLFFFLAPLLLIPLEAGKTHRQAPEFIVQLPDGGQFRVADHKGKVVVVEIMKTTCPTCRRASHAIDKLYQELGSQGFQPVAAAIDENPEKLVAPYVLREGLAFPIGWSDRDSVLRLVHQPIGKLWYVPQLIFIDRKGIIRAQYGGDEYFVRNPERSIREVLAELLAEKASD